MKIIFIYFQKKIFYKITIPSYCVFLKNSYPTRKIFLRQEKKHKKNWIFIIKKYIYRDIRKFWRRKKRGEIWGELKRHKKYKTGRCFYQTVFSYSNFVPLRFFFFLSSFFFFFPLFIIIFKYFPFFLFLLFLKYILFYFFT